MDERLSKALEFANFMTTINNQKRILKEQYKENLVYCYQGGQFTVTRELINFVSFLISQENTNNVVIVDDNDIPIMVKDLQEFFSNLLDSYFTASNKYYQSYSGLSKKRSMETFLNNE